jgi:hypothetical protein
VTGVIAQFAKASPVAKLKAARDRRISAGIKCGGRRSHAEKSLELVAAARALQAVRPRLSPRKIASRLAEQGYVGVSGRPVGTEHAAGLSRRYCVAALALRLRGSFWP